MRQARGKTKVLLVPTTADNGLPSGDAGLDMTSFGDIMPNRDWLLSVIQTVTSGDASYFLHARINGNWGTLGPNGGEINSLVALADTNTLHEVFNTMGMFERIYLRVDVNGTPAGFTTRADLIAVSEKRD